MNKPVIRPYAPSDKNAVRAISWLTADTGAPAEWFPDKELLADILTGYYLTYEQDLCFVPVEDNTVTGYIAGCRNTLEFKRRMRNKVLPTAFFKALASGTLCRPWFLRIAANNFKLLMSKQPEVDYNSFPSHLHINMLPENRGKQIGQRLLETLQAALIREKSPGLHLSVREDNEAGIKFFKKNGFQTAGRHKFFKTADNRLLYSLTMTKALL